jgi:hypothetical protein
VLFVNLHPRQIIGIIAIVVFGGILVWTLLKPKPDRFSLPGAIPMTDLPSAQKAPAAPVSATPSDPLAVGSDEAKDDLYCAGVILAVYAANGGSGAALNVAPLRTQADRLHEAGVGKLTAEGVDEMEAAFAANAQSEKARVDVVTSYTPRITLEACQARAAALPPK